MGMKPRRCRTSVSCVRAIAALLTLLAVPAWGARIVEWRAEDAEPRAAWVMERFGNVREATVRAGRGAGGAPAALARFASRDASRPTASLRFPVAFQALRTYRVTLEVSAPSPVRAELIVRRRSAPYDPMSVRTVDLDERWQTVELRAIWPVGAAEGDVRVQIRDAEGSVAVRRLVVEDEGPAPLGTSPAAPFPPTLIGIHVNKLGQHVTWPAAGQAMVRLWDTGTAWTHLAPTIEDFDAFRGTGWRRFDAYVDYIVRNRPDATILYTLGMPPQWASADPQARCPYGTGTCGAPASIDAWRHYVRTVAQRYRGRIRHWELWNEADYTMFYTRGRPMTELAKAASEELKAVDPQNRLLSPGYTNSGGLNALAGFLQDGGGRHVDIIGFHWYFGDRPEQLAAPIGNIRRLMEEHGVGAKPIWNTEGAPLCQRRDRGRCVLADLSPAEQEALAARAILTMWLNGVEGFAYYTAEGAGGRTLALLNEDFKASTSAAAALQRLGEWMVGARALSVAAWGRSGHVVEAQRASRRFAIVWSEAPDETFPIPPGWRTTAVERLDGGAASVAGGRLSVGRVPVRITLGS